jgi:hypothetical protein
LDPLDELENKRSDFLRKLYELSSRNEHKFFNMWEIGDQLGFDRDLTLSISQYLAGQGLLKFRAIGGIISITHYGIRETEENLKNIEKSTQKKSIEEQETITLTDSASNPNHIKQFWSKIQGRNTWKYFEIKACFIKYHESDDWKITFLRIELLKERIDFHLVDFRGHRLRLIRSIKEIALLNDLFEEMSSKNTLSIGSETGSLELFGGKFLYGIVRRSQASEDYEMDYPCHELSAAGIYPTELMNIQRYLEIVLPLDNPPYHDLRHACKKELNIEHGTPAFGTSFAILAPIYIRVHNIEFNDKEIRLDIDNEMESENYNLKLVLFGLDDSSQPNDFVYSLDLDESTEKRIYSKKIEYEQKFASLSYKLYHNRELIEDNIIAKHRVGVAQNNWSKMLIERIDPDLKILESWIKGKGKDPEIEFEKGIAILLHLCGFQTVHVGDKYEMAAQQTRRETYSKSTVSIDVIIFSKNDEIYICQCTTEWTKNKITDLLDISQELKSRFSQRDIKPKINPVLFTKVEKNMLSETIRQAEENKVKVVSIEDLLALLEEIKNDKEPSKQAKNLLSS